MGIQIIPGPGDQIAGTIKDIASGIDKFINPNKDLQLAVQRAAATNPELLQHMADLEANAPGTMGRLGLGQLAPIIGAIPQSAQAAGEAATRPRAAEQATSAQSAAIATSNATTAKAQLTGDLVKKAGNIMAQDPNISFDAALKTLGLDTQSERTVADTKAKVTVAEGDKALATVLRARQLPEDLSEIDWTTEARSFLNGDLAGSAAAAYFGNPDTREAFSTAIREIMTQRQIDATTAWHAMRGQGVDNLEKRQAFAWYTKTGGVADLDTWRQYLFRPEARQRAAELLAGAKPANDQEKALLQIAQVNKEFTNSNQLRNVAKINDAISTAMKRVEDADTPDKKQQAINSLNLALKQRAALGGMDVQAEWKDEKWYNLLDSDRLIFKDKNGKVVDPENVQAIIADPEAKDLAGPAMSQAAQRSLEAILALPPSARGAALNKLRMQMQGKNAGVTKEVEDALNRISGEGKRGIQGAPIDSSSVDFGGGE